MRTRPTTRRTLAGLAIAAAASSAACGNSGDSTQPPAALATSTPAPASSADTAAASTEALKAYAGYLAASTKASRTNDPFHPELSKYLADPLLTRVRLAIRDAKAHGAVRAGTLKSNPTVTAVDLQAVPATVEIQDCLDATGYRLVFVTSRKAVPGTSARRYLATATATRYAGRWLISTGTAHQDQPC